MAYNNTNNSKKNENQQSSLRPTVELYEDIKHIFTEWLRNADDTRYSNLTLLQLSYQYAAYKQFPNATYQEYSDDEDRIALLIIPYTTSDVYLTSDAFHAVEELSNSFYNLFIIVLTQNSFYSKFTTLKNTNIIHLDDLLKDVSAISSMDDEINRIISYLGEQALDSVSKNTTHSKSTTISLHFSWNKQADSNDTINANTDSSIPFDSSPLSENIITLKPENRTLFLDDNWKDALKTGDNWIFSLYFLSGQKSKKIGDVSIWKKKSARKTLFELVESSANFQIIYYA